MKASTTTPGRVTSPDNSAARLVDCRYLLPLAAFLLVPFAPCAASSDGALLPGESVVDRARPELDASGIPMGAFRLRLAVDLSLARDSNIFAQDTDEQDDRILTVSPRLELTSGWSRHSLDLVAEADVGRYDDNGAEDFDDYAVGANLRLDLTRASALRFGGRFDSVHEDRFAPDDVNGVEPTEYERSVFTAGYARRSGRVAVRAEAGLRRWNYYDVDSTLGTVNNDDRDRSEVSLSLRAGYEWRPQIEFYVQAGVDNRDYDDDADDNGLDRSSDGANVAVGVQAALSGASYVEGFAGYSKRDYDDGLLDSLDTPWFGGRLVWNPTGLTTVTLEGRRAIEETTFDQASGYVATRLGVGVDHELKRNLLLRAGGYTQTNDYEGVDREDDVTYLELGATYMMNRNLWVLLDYTRRERDVSPNDTSDYEMDVIRLTVRGQR